MGNKRWEHARGGAPSDGSRFPQDMTAGSPCMLAILEQVLDTKGQHNTQSKAEDVKMGEREIYEAKIISGAL